MFKLHYITKIKKNRQYNSINDIVPWYAEHRSNTYRWQQPDDCESKMTGKKPWYQIESCLTV